MSNCIEIVKGAEATFSGDELDIPRYKELLRTAVQWDYRTPLTDEIRVSNTAWWWLQDNSVVNDNGVTIKFGNGRSSHTERDFNGTLEILALFMKKSKTHTFFITGEGDGFKKMHRLYVDFKLGKSFPIRRTHHEGAVGSGGLSFPVGLCHHQP